jgi:hypothetical protein
MSDSEAFAGSVVLGTGSDDRGAIFDLIEESLEGVLVVETVVTEVDVTDDLMAMFQPPKPCLNRIRPLDLRQPSIARKDGKRL